MKKDASIQILKLPYDTGLTLIEVLLAVSILTIGLTVLLVAASRCLVVMRMSGIYHKVELAMNMGEVENPLVVTDDVEDLEVDPVTYNDDFTFSRKIDEDDDEDGLFVVHSIVTWRSRGHVMKEEIIRYVLQPDNDKK